MFLTWFDLERRNDKGDNSNGFWKCWKFGIPKKYPREPNRKEFHFHPQTNLKKLYLRKIYAKMTHFPNDSIMNKWIDLILLSIHSRSRYFYLFSLSLSLSLSWEKFAV